MEKCEDAHLDVVKFGRMFRLSHHAEVEIWSANDER